MNEETGIHLVRMPKWGLSMQEGTITRWHVAPGARVARGEPLCDVETAKISNEFEAPATGVVARLLAAPQDIVPVGRIIAVLAEDGVASAQIDAAVAQSLSESIRPEASPLPELQRVQTGGASLAYLGAGAGPSREAVVFLHGFGGNHGNWMLNQGALAARHRTIAFDLPGHGASDKTIGGDRAADLALPIKTALEALDLRPIHLIAHSFGALIALRLADEVQTASLTLIAPLGLGVPPNPDYIRGFVKAERKRDLKPIMEMLFADPSLLSREMVNDALGALRDGAARTVLRRIGESLLAGTETGTEADFLTLARFRHQVIWGAGDRIVPLPPGLAGRLGERLQVVERSGHMPHLEQAQRVNALIERFIQG